ncbi:helix-turn-helix transcriptional regulator [Streptomyces sp. NPDC057136]|uniref:helix-turn-helix transcriptional regulator n=1 Tax=Streptomyces sp. NPDC057136 TaxID=3346029 RepID=UPI0036370F6F
MRTRTSPPPGLIYIADTPSGPGIASRLGILPATFRKWRVAGRGPACFKIGGRVVAREDAVAEYITAQEQQCLVRSA